jgi:hypothetical protein
MLHGKVAIVEEPLSTVEIRHRSEDAVDIHLVVHQSIGASPASRYERDRRDLVSEREDGLFGASFILAGVRRNDPERVGTLLL